MRTAYAYALLRGLTLVDIDAVDPPLQPDDPRFGLLIQEVIENTHLMVVDMQLEPWRSLARAILRGYYYHDAPRHLSRDLYPEGGSMQLDTETTAACLALSHLTAIAINETLSIHAFSSLWASVSDISDTFNMRFRRIGHVLGWGSAHYAIRHLGTGATATEIAVIATYCLLRHPENISSALQCAVYARENVPTIASVVSAIHCVQSQPAILALSPRDNRYPELRHLALMLASEKSQ